MTIEFKQAFDFIRWINNSNWCEVRLDKGKWNDPIANKWATDLELYNIYLATNE